MTNLRQLEDTILANGRVESPELEVLRRELYAGGKIGRREADFLVELHKRVQRKTPAFEQFFYQAIKHHVLQDGRVFPSRIIHRAHALHSVQHVVSAVWATSDETGTLPELAASIRRLVTPETAGSVARARSTGPFGRKSCPPDPKITLNW